MQIGVSEEAINGRNQALYILLSPGVQQQLQMEGATINVKDLLISVLEDNGVKNAAKLFNQGNPINGQIPGQLGQTPAGAANNATGIGSFGGSQMSAYGTSEAVREIHEFMAKQEYEVKRLTKKQNDPQEYGL
jgi:hypothetical protein